MKIKSAKIAVIIFLITVSGLSPVHYRCFSAQGDAPEDVVIEYFYDYMQKDWEGCIRCLHPQFLITLKLQIINIIKKTDGYTQRKLLRAYNVKTIEELRKMPSKELYALYLADLWERNNPHFSKDFNKANIKILGTKKIDTAACLVEFQSSVNVDNVTYDQIEEYAVKKQGKKWKIYSTDKLKDSELR
jgi:hypothetical protein